MVDVFQNNADTADRSLQLTSTTRPIVDMASSTTNDAWRAMTCCNDPPTDTSNRGRVIPIEGLGVLDCAPDLPSAMGTAHTPLSSDSIENLPVAGASGTDQDVPDSGSNPRRPLFEADRINQPPHNRPQPAADRSNQSGHNGPQAETDRSDQPTHNRPQPEANRSNQIGPNRPRPQPQPEPDRLNEPPPYRSQPAIDRHDTRPPNRPQPDSFSQQRESSPERPHSLTEIIVSNNFWFNRAANEADQALNAVPNLDLQVRINERALTAIREERLKVGEQFDQSVSGILSNPDYFAKLVALSGTENNVNQTVDWDNPNVQEWLRDHPSIPGTAAALEHLETLSQLQLQAAPFQDRNTELANIAKAPINIRLRHANYLAGLGTPEADRHARQLLGQIEQQSPWFLHQTQHALYPNMSTQRQNFDRLANSLGYHQIVQNYDK